MNIELQRQLLKLKGVLNDISHASFSYSSLSKKLPLDELTYQQKKDMIAAYEDIIHTVKSSIMNYENPNDKDRLLGR